MTRSDSKAMVFDFAIVDAFAVRGSDELPIRAHAPITLFVDRLGGSADKLWTVAQRFAKRRGGNTERLLETTPIITFAVEVPRKQADQLELLRLATRLVAQLEATTRS